MPYAPKSHSQLMREKYGPAPDTRPTAAQRGYGSRWQKARAGYLRKHPLCVMCEREGRTTIATVVDHIKPHGGDKELFWDSSNWQALCKECHNSTKRRQENRLKRQGDKHNGNND